MLGNMTVQAMDVDTETPSIDVLLTKKPLGPDVRGDQGSRRKSRGSSIASNTNEAASGKNEAEVGSRLIVPDPDSGAQRLLSSRLISGNRGPRGSANPTELHQGGFASNFDTQIAAGLFRRGFLGRLGDPNLSISSDSETFPAPGSI